MKHHSLAVRAALLLALHLSLGTISLRTTRHLLAEACHPPMTTAAQVVAVLVWPITLWAADSLPSRC